MIVRREIKFRAWDKDTMQIKKGSKGMYKQNGYVMAKAEYHPHSNKRGYVPVHRLVMENELERYLEPRKELVHHIDGDRSNNELTNLKLTTPREHYLDEHFEKRNPNGRFVAADPFFTEIKYRLFDRDKNITQFYTLQELISKTFRRAKFQFRGRFTGLKDRNGVEIYEGDVLSDVISQGKKVLMNVIVYEKGAFRHKFLDENTRHLRGREIEPMFDNTSLIFEVTGNIHEHPHLLPKEEEQT